MSQNISTILKRLALGELSNLSLVSKASPGEILSKYVPSVVSHMNDGLVQIYTRLLLLEKEVVILTVPAVTKYYLRPDRAARSEKLSGIKYINDSVDYPFTGDLIKILGVYDERGVKVPLNDRNDPLSIFTSETDVLSVTDLYLGTYLSVLYQASHPILNHNNLEQNINIPSYLVQTLCDYVASKVYGAMNGVANMRRSQEYMGAYENALFNVKIDDIAITSRTSTNTKFEQKGFV